MSVKSVIYAALVALALTTSAQAQDYVELPSETVQSDWALFTVPWQDRSDTIEVGTIFGAGPDGTLVVCGVFQFKGNVGGVARQAQRAFYLSMNGTRVVRSFGWMPIVRQGRSLVGQEADCRNYPDVQVPDNADFRIDLSRRRF